VKTRVDIVGGTSQSSPQTSLFASMASQSQNRQSGEPSTYFDTILEKSRKRALGETSDGDFPQLQLGLGDLRQRIKRFAPGTPNKAVDGRAHYLLAASGVDPGTAVRDLNFLSSAAGRVERPQHREASDTDVDGYLANLQTQTTLNMISDGLARSVRDFETFLEDNVTMEWDAQRKRIYEHFGIKQRGITATGGKSGFATSDSQGGFGRSRRSKAAALAGSRASGTLESSTFGNSVLQRSVIGTPAPIGSSFQPLFSDIGKRMEANGIAAPDPNDRFQRERQARLAEKVQKLNGARLRKHCFPILHEFRNVAKEGGEEHSISIVKAYGAMIKIVNEYMEDVPLSHPSAVKERQFAEAYLDETPNSPNNNDIKKRIICGSSSFLENLFFEEVEAYIAKSPREANLGGVPNVISKVKAYVRLRGARKDLAPDNTDLQMLNDDYVWALVFYLIRSGHVQEAVEYVNTNAVAFRAIDRNFASYITDYYNSDDRRLRRELQERINSEYNQRLRIAPENSIDPFRMACYKVIGRCDLRNRALESGVHQSMEDYMWLQFILAREVNKIDELATEVCNLASVQTVIKEIGSRFFTKGENYGAYFYLQILGGFFEEAVEYLYPYSYPDAVHFAIALDYYGLLRVSDPDSIGESSLLSFTTRGLPQIKFGHMVGHYTRDFRAANVTAAVDYLTLICLNRDLPGQLGTKQVALCHDALRELVLESREFALLLGDIQHDGQRIKGVIEDRMKLIALEETDEFMRTITIQAASVADDNGRVTDAVLLYHLAEEYDNVVVIITRAMSEAVSVQIGQDQMRLQTLKPRSVPDSQRAQTNSLSLTSVDDPYILGKNMSDLYRSSSMYVSKIKEANQQACDILLTASMVKIFVEEGNWVGALDVSFLSIKYPPISHANLHFSG
jgi:nuclear pore complex protein Nup93